MDNAIATGMNADKIETASKFGRFAISEKKAEKLNMMKPDEDPSCSGCDGCSGCSGASCSGCATCSAG